MKILILLPTYNEKENLARLCDEILKAAPFVHVLIIDDNSPDGTGRIADELAEKSGGRVFARHRTRKLGLGSAIMEGFRCAMSNSYNIVINMDCDFSHDPKELPQIIETIRDADLVVASRHVKGGGVVGWGVFRRILHWVAQQYTNLVLGRYVHDHTNSFKAYKVEMLKKLPLEELLKSGSGYVWHTLLIHSIHKMGYRIKEVPSVFIDRRAGRSKMTIKEMIGGLMAILKMGLGI